MNNTPAFIDEVLPMAVNPKELFDPSPCGYSQVVLAPAGWQLAFISGQGGADPTGVLPSSFEAQVEAAYANLRAALRSVGAGPDHVVKLTLFVVDHEASKLAVLGRCLSNVFGEARPAQTLVSVPALALDGMMFEVEAIVVVGVRYE